MRRILRRFLPNHDAVRGNRWLARFENTLLHPRLWHLNRRSAAGAVAVGLFCGLIPGPLQMFGAAIGAVMFRVNLPLALLATFYTNPLTIVPLYLIAFEIGNLAMGRHDSFIAPPAFTAAPYAAWLDATIEWMFRLGQPLVFGIFLLACTLSALGYLAVRLAWRVYLVQAWRKRHPTP